MMGGNVVDLDDDDDNAKLLFFNHTLNDLDKLNYFITFQAKKILTTATLVTHSIALN